MPTWQQLDEHQRRAVLAGGRVLRVVGAPGTGKTTVALHRLRHAVRFQGRAAHEVLLVAPTRARAATLRERLSRMLDVTTTHVPVRAVESLAFSILRARSHEDDTLAGPQLITGAEQDVILAELMAGHAAGVGCAPEWPEHLRAAAATRGLRSELRELLMRLAEEGVDALELRELAARHEVPVWKAAADVLAEYEDVIALARPGACDAAALLAQATRSVTERSERDGLVGTLRLIVVDDAQELTVAAARLLRRLTDLGVELMLIGDPDAATQSFRGAQPQILGQVWPGERLDLDVGSTQVEHTGKGSDTAAGPGLPMVLRSSHRAGPVLLGVTDRVCAQIGAAGVVRHRRPQPLPDPVGRDAFEGASKGGPAEGCVEVSVWGSQAQEARHIATVLRRAHLLDAVPWEQLAVIVRTGTQAAGFRRALSAEGIPVTVPGARVPLREEPAVRPLLTLLELSLARRPHLDGGRVTDLLTSRLGGMDSLGVRAVRRALRRAELEAGGVRSSDELLAAALSGQLGRPVPTSLAGLAEALAAGRRTAGQEPLGSDSGQLDDGPSSTAGVDEVLWAMWSHLGKAQSWRAQALRGGAAGARADRDLDAVCELFDAASRYVERLPGSRPRGFLDHVAAADVPADSLVARRVRAGEVTLTTPAGAVGGQWHTVVVAGVQEGVWPDLRPRGSTLQIPRLLDAIAGLTDEVAAGSLVLESDRVRRIRHDEARLLHVAVSRARRVLHVTAVRDEENRPSPYLDLIDPRPDIDEPRALSTARRPLSEAGVVADLRNRLVTETDDRVRVALAARLARLVDFGVAAADPDRWWAGNKVSDDRPVRPDQAQVGVSPSRVESFSRCGLRWFLTACGGQSTHESASVAIGNLVHEIAADVDNADESAMHEELMKSWPRLGLGTGWLVRRQYEQARLMLTRLARYHAEARRDGWQLVGRELQADVGVGRAVVRGRVDRLERDAHGRLRVVDLKTGASKPARSELPRLPQLGAYQVAVARGAFGSHGARSAGAALLQLGKAAGSRITLQVQERLDTDPDPQWAANLLQEVAEGMAAPTFQARVGEGCRHCPVFDACPQQASRWVL